MNGTVLAFVMAGCDRSPQPSPGNASTMAHARTGVASYYGREFAGKKTANGEQFKLDAMTAASRTLPLGSHAQVINLETGETARVRINDRGPYAKGRLIDLSPRAARHVGIGQEKGVARVSVVPIAVSKPVSDRAPQ